MSFNADRFLAETFAEVRHSESELFDDQRAAIDFLKRTPFSALYADVGKGKTVVSWSIIDWLWQRGYYGKILIIAPIRVIRTVWPYEPRQWSHLAYHRMTVIRVQDDDPRLKAAYRSGYKYARSKGYGPDMCQKIAQRSRTKRKEELLKSLLDSPEQVHGINREAVPWLVDQFAKRASWPYKVVFVDEASCLGDHKNQIFKSLKRVRPYIKRLHELTASPASQTYMRFFSQIWLLDKGDRFGSTITSFRERYFTQSPYTRRWTIRPGAAEEMERLIADICLVQRRDRDFQVNVRQIQLPENMMEAYREFERDLVLELPDGVTIDGVNAAVLSGKLLQYASGAVYDKSVVLDEDGNPVLNSRGIVKVKRFYHEIHDEKIEELHSLVEETIDQPLLVAYWFQSSLERLRKAFPDAGVMDRQGRIVDDWNRRRYKMLLVHPRSAGHGLNMQKGGHHIVLFDIFWPLELFLQLVGRLDRTGQTETVMVHLLSCVGTHDEVVAENLRFLRETEDAMFRRLQELRRRFSYGR